jgi:hypothetical protein
MRQRPRDRTPNYRLPDPDVLKAASPAFAEVAAHYEAMRADHRETHARRTSLEAAVSEARRADIRERASWISEGREGKDPGQRGEERARKALDAVQSEVDAVRLALDTAADQVEQAFEANRSELEAFGLKLQAETREHASIQVEATAASLDHLTAATRFLAWTRRFPVASLPADGAEGRRRGALDVIRQDLVPPTLEAPDLRVVGEGEDQPEEAIG